MDSYDAIIYGNDLSTMICALYLAKHKKHVLLIDNKRRVGDNDNKAILRRFTIEDNTNTLVFNPNNKEDKITKILNELGIKTDFICSRELVHLLSDSKHINYVFPVGIDNFIRQIESYIPGSTEHLKEFFTLAKECLDASEFIMNNKSSYDYKSIKKEYPNFVKVLGKNVSNILDYLNMPIDVQEVLNTFWIYFGTTETEISFVDYSTFLYNYISYNNQVPSLGLENFYTTLLKEYMLNKGEYINNIVIDKIITLDNEVNGVLIDDKMYYTKKLITSINPSYIYNELIEKSEVNKKALKLCNKRILTGRKYTLYLGLNRSTQELGITNYKYILNNTLDTDVEYKKMTYINHNNVIVTIPNLLNNTKEDGTSTIIMDTMFMNDSFFQYVDGDNYLSIKDDIANNLINAFEERTGINIKDYIEEIKIYTPLDYEIKYKDSVGYGYKIKGMDSLLFRYLNEDKEEYIKGLKICGKYGVYGGLDSSLILSGYYEAMKVLKGE